MDKQRIMVVSGVPRSGTSLLMKMLEAAGIPILSDGLRQADDDNPKGYYEFEPVKQLGKGNNAWIDKARGKAVKIVSPLLKHLPTDHHYDVIFMRRDLQEVLASQRKMLERSGQATDPDADEKLAALFKVQLEETIAWAKSQENLRVIEVQYAALVKEPLQEIAKLRPLLPAEIEPEAMAAVVDPALYRQRVA